MVLYPFETQLVLTTDLAGHVVPSANVTLYAPSDTARSSPLTLVDAFGLPIANPITTSPQGFAPAFQATVPQVMWSGAGFSGYLSSFQGVLSEATLAKTSAASAAGDAATAKTAALAAQTAAQSGSLAPTETAIAEALLRADWVGAGAVPGTILFVRQSAGGTWPARPTASANVMVMWIGWSNWPPIVSSGTAGMRDNLDARTIRPAP